MITRKDIRDALMNAIDAIGPDDPDRTVKELAKLLVDLDTESSDAFFVRATNNHKIAYAATRGVLHHLAHALVGLSREEADAIISTVIGELVALRSGDTSADVWNQAISGMSGPELYGLERIGLLLRKNTP